MKLGERAELRETLRALRRVARLHGYALTLHGSRARDLDLVAIAWTDNASSPDRLATALLLALNGCRHNGEGGLPTQKAHGRLAYTILVPAHEPIGGCLYVDLSVMPPHAATEETPT